MATYAIGDVQGCYDELQRLLREVSFDPLRDRLWFVGDLVNRGPKSLDVLRFVADLGERAVAVLGNHDLHFLAQYAGVEHPRRDDTLDELLGAGDAAGLAAWLRERPMMHVEGAYAMVHAGLLPQWSVDRARELGSEVERALAGADCDSFLKNMYGSQPDRWEEALSGWDRLRVIVNAMTRCGSATGRAASTCKARGRNRATDTCAGSTPGPPASARWFSATGRSSGCYSAST